MKNKKPLYIVILGPDGSGKTSIANDLYKKLSDIGDNVLRYNFSFKILPSISSMLKRKRKLKFKPGTEHIGMVNPLNSLRASILSLWYGLDHIIGSHLIMRNNNQIDAIIFARSYHDFYYQRAYMNAPKRLLKILNKISYPPSIVIVPHRSSDEIFKQKPELTQKEIENQYSKIIKNLGNSNNFFLVDASNGLTETVDKIFIEVNRLRKKRK